MKKLLGILVLGLLLVSTTVNASGFDIKRATGVCKANNSNLDFNLDTYNKTFINIKVRAWDEKTDVEGKEGDWENTMYFLMGAWSKAMEECAGGNKEVCKIIIEHTKYLADNNGLKRGYSWEDYDYVFEATFFNNHDIFPPLVGFSDQSRVSQMCMTLCGHETKHESGNESDK